MSSRDVSRFIDVVETRARADVVSVERRRDDDVGRARLDDASRVAHRLETRRRGESATWNASIARALDCGEIACAVDPNAGESMVARINDVTVSARALREVEVVDADGARETIGNIAGDASPVVLVVLRHLG